MVWGEQLSREDCFAGVAQAISDVWMGFVIGHAVDRDYTDEEVCSECDTTQPADDDTDEEDGDVSATQPADEEEEDDEAAATQPADDDYAAEYDDAPQPPSPAGTHVATDDED